MSRAITRLAPTPSGYLHEGNAINFLIVDRLARENDAAVALRIDDADVHRYRAEYVEDIFDVLRWLGPTWVLGPRDRTDLEASHSQRTRTQYYRGQLSDAKSRGLELFACLCTRAEIAAAGAAGCIGDCRGAEHALVPGRSALRTTTTYGDVVLWRRDDLPAYHLVSIVEDRDLGTTLVVRGEDLLESTAVQQHLAPYFGADALAGATFVHHPLVRGSGGRKVSKSQRSGGAMAKDDEHRARLRSLADEFAF